jgi:hypothetical protein
MQILASKWGGGGGGGGGVNKKSGYLYGKLIFASWVGKKNIIGQQKTVT